MPTDLEVPFVLVASPVMNDPNFARSVVLIAHFDASGALGWIVNRTLEVKPMDVLPSRLAEVVDPSAPVRLGGPVETSVLTVLVRGDNEDDSRSTRVAPGLRSSLDPAILRDAFGDPRSAVAGGLLVIGYSGWGAGQLDAELTQGWWFLLPFRPDLAFPADSESVWERALAEVGLKPDTPVMRSSGVH